MLATNFISAISQPTGMWAKLIEWVHSWVGGNYGWTILVLIILVKLVLFPLDYLIKHSSKKTSLAQQKIAPQMAKLQKKYGNDKNMLNAQTQALYKREGFNVFGSCFIMLINLVVTFAVFITLFNGLRTLSSYQAISQYDNLQQVYQQSVTADYGDYETYKAIVLRNLAKEGDDNYNPLSAEELQKYNQAVKTAQSKVQQKWQNVRQNWLWIENIWVTDGHSNPLPNLNSLKSMASTSKNAQYIAYVNNIAGDKVLSAEYSQIESAVISKTGSWNGYYLLAIFSVLLSIASQVITDLSTKTKSKKTQNIVDQANPQGKGMGFFMKLLLPVIMAIFVLTTNAAFGIYVITNSIMGIIISAITNLIVDAVFKKKQAEVELALEKEAKIEERRQQKRRT